MYRTFKLRNRLTMHFTTRSSLTTSLLLVFYLALQGCATNPVTGGKDFVLMSESEEISLGRKYHQQITLEMPVYENAALTAYVNEVGQRIAKASHRPGLTFRFTVLDSDTVNAFALPGGYIYITRGILAYLNSEAELAAVLGHEVGHVTARHSVRQHSAATATNVAGAILGATTGVAASQDLFNVFGKAMLSGYGREHELESDRLGAQYLARTGYDPQAMIEVIGVLKNQELFERQRARAEGREARAYHGVFASHPENDRRLQEVVGEAESLKTTDKPRVGRKVFLDHINGMTFGASENDGMVVDNHFYHKPLDFRLTFAKSWSVQNQPDRLVAVAPNQAAIMEIMVAERPPGVSPLQFMQQQGIKKPLRGETLNLKGFDTYAAVTPLKTGFGQRNARVIVLFDRSHAYLFTAVSRSTDNQKLFDGQFKDVARSFRRLNASEKKLASGQKLHMIKAKGSTRFSALAAKSPIRKYADAELRLLNDLYPEGEPKAGQTLKIVR
jgi:predicted Zn-dependent protease